MSAQCLFSTQVCALALTDKDVPIDRWEPRFARDKQQVPTIWLDCGSIFLQTLCWFEPLQSVLFVFLMKIIEHGMNLANVVRPPALRLLVVTDQMECWSRIYRLCVFQIED
jgi:hypothetical protein